MNNTENVTELTRAQILMQAIPAGIHEVDLAGRTTYVNDAFCRMYGYAEHELLGKEIFDFPASVPERRRLQVFFKAVIQKQPPLTPYEAKTLTKDRRELDVRVDWNYRRDPAGRLIGLIGVITDITDLKQREEDIRKHRDIFEQLVEQRTTEIVEMNLRLQQEIIERKQAEERLQLAYEELTEKTTALELLNEELSHYIDVVSHDLKTSLRGIHNYVDFLDEDLRTLLTAEQNRYLEGLRCVVRDASSLLEGLLQLSRIGRHTVRLESIRIEMALQGLVNGLYSDANIEIVWAYDFPVIQADRVLFLQIFKNLIDNALTFNASSHKRIEIGWQIVPSEGYEFFVRDNGIGFELQYQDLIFSPFRRLHLKEQYQGHGVGLAVVEKAVKKLGGRFRVVSQPGEGSTFFVTLPQPPGR